MLITLLNLIWLLGAMTFGVDHYRHTSPAAFVACHRDRSNQGTAPFANSSWMWDRHFWGVIGTLGWPLLIWPYALVVRPRAELAEGALPVSHTAPAPTRYAHPKSTPPAAESTPESGVARPDRIPLASSPEVAEPLLAPLASTQVNGPAESPTDASPDGVKSSSPPIDDAGGPSAQPVQTRAAAASELTMRIALAMQLGKVERGPDGRVPSGLTGILDCVRSVLQAGEQPLVAAAIGEESTGRWRTFRADVFRNTPDALLFYPDHVLLVLNPIRDGSYTSLAKALLGSALPGGKAKVTPHWRYANRTLRDVQLTKTNEPGEAREVRVSFTANDRAVSFGVDLAITTDEELERAVAQLTAASHATGESEGQRT